jgi:hypothetical protein
MLTSRISRHARISGDCPVCLYPLQGRNITKRPCEHMLCTPCYLDGVSMGFKDSSFNADACEQCRITAFTKTRAGSTLMEHFTASKQLMVATATATLKRKDAPRGPRPRSLGPSAGSARDAGTEERVSKPKRSKKKAAKIAKKREEKGRCQTGGFALQGRGQVRAEGIAVPVGTRRTCLPDATWALLMARFPNTKINLDAIRAAVSSANGADPSFSMANAHVQDYGLELKYDRELNNPRAMFKRRSGLYLVQLAIETESGSDQHYVAYLAASGHIIDNEPRALVPIIKDSDRRSNKAAIKVFQQLFPRATGIRMGAVSELRTVSERADRKPRFACGLLFEPYLVGYSPYWSSTTKPTHKDLFYELYDQKVINHDELVDCAITMSWHIK